MKDLIDSWEAEAKLTSLGQTLNPTTPMESARRILALISALRVQEKALRSYAADSFDSATSLADHDFMGYGATARAALAEVESILKG